MSACAGSRGLRRGLSELNSRRTGDSSGVSNRASCLAKGDREDLERRRDRWLRAERRSRQSSQYVFSMVVIFCRIQSMSARDAMASAANSSSALCSASASRLGSALRSRMRCAVFRLRCKSLRSSASPTTSVVMTSCSLSAEHKGALTRCGVLGVLGEGLLVDLRLFRLEDRFGDGDRLADDRGIWIYLGKKCTTCETSAFFFTIDSVKCTRKNKAVGRCAKKVCNQLQCRPLIESNLANRSLP